jgi:hypothetical protein
MTATLQATFQVRLGEMPTEFNPRENSYGSLLLSTGIEPIALESDVEVDLTVPAVPAFVTLRGRVLRADGTPAGSAYVQAYSGSLVGVTGGFSAFVTADRDGVFRLRLLPGERYGIYVYDYGN